MIAPWKTDKAFILMGIVNVTPDSFSDGGQYNAPDQAIRHGLRLIEEGADILDIGGESTRPGASPVSPAEEQDRILPVIEGLKDSGAYLSIDTRHAQTMTLAIQAGAQMINDVQALQGDGSLESAADLKVPVCLMHMKGAPQSMQVDPHYEDVAGDVVQFFERRIAECEKAGLTKDDLLLDPGIGFGKSLEHNLKLLKNIVVFKGLGCEILLGTSRKSFIEKIDKGAKADQRIGGSLASILQAYQKGVRVFRVHDVFATRQALLVDHAIRNA